MPVHGFSAVACNSATAFTAQGLAAPDTGQDGVLSLPRAVAQDMVGFDEAIASGHHGQPSGAGVYLGVGLGALLAHLR